MDNNNKRIEILVKYKEILINDKEFDSFNESELTEIFSKIKHKINDTFSKNMMNNQIKKKVIVKVNFLKN